MSMNKLCTKCKQPKGNNAHRSWCAECLRKSMRSDYVREMTPQEIAEKARNENGLCRIEGCGRARAQMTHYVSSLCSYHHNQLRNEQRAKRRQQIGAEETAPNKSPLCPKCNMRYCASIWGRFSDTCRECGRKDKTFVKPSEGKKSGRPTKQAKRVKQLEIIRQAHERALERRGM